MSPISTLRTTISAAVIAAMLAGCASTSGPRVVSKGFGGRSGGDLGLATRALAALNANDFAAAVALAERAVEKTPADAGFRTLLGNAYFAAGRFRSAEQAYKDALSIYANQPQAVLKLALVLVAQGKNDEAIRFLDVGRESLDPADVGLAMALAGRAQDAVALLDHSARANGADARIRQNLALAYALSGNWQQARIVAAQDVPADQLDSRMEQWMAMTRPGKPSDPVAALVGVAPAPADPGQPVRLALVKEDRRLAEAAPAVAPQPPPEPVPVPVAEVAPINSQLAPVTLPVAPVTLPVAAVAEPQPVASRIAEFEAALAPVRIPADPEPAFAEAVPPAPPPPNPLRVAAVSPAEAPLALAETARQILPKVRAAAASESRPKVLRASAPAPVPAAGKSSAVLQLGAYKSQSRVLVAWDAAARRFKGLEGYTPVSARFDGPGGTVYRLSVKGFASRSEATALCESLRRSGGACFVRNAAGDRPIQYASR